MYYPFGWRKVLKLDFGLDDSSEQTSQILQVQANHERELFFILTSSSLHIWFPKPTTEIVCHRRSRESIEKIGLNKSAIWKTDSSVIVVATEHDQLLFYQIKKRIISSSASTFLKPTSGSGNGIYRLNYNPKNTKKLLNGQLPYDTSASSQIPALTMFSFGKLDLSSVGISCLMAAEEELVVGSRSGDMYGVHWDGNVDEKFPWSLSKEVQARGDYLVDMKFSSVLSGFAFVFRSGRVGFMPLRLKDSTDQTMADDNSDVLSCDTSISYLPNVNDAILVEINHRHRLIAFGLKSSQVVVCNIDENQTKILINHVLQLDPSRIPHDPNRFGPIKAMSYSPDNAALAIAWIGGDMAIWSVFGSLLFCSQQWQQERETNAQSIKPIRIQSLAWGREGYNLWLCTRTEEAVSEELEGSTLTDSTSISCDLPQTESATSMDKIERLCDSDQVVLMPLAHCNLTSSPQSTCSSDSIVLMAEDKLFVGPSVPQEDKFDHWIVICIPGSYLASHYPIKHAIVDRDCKRLAISGIKSVAFYSIESNKWHFLPKKAQDKSFCVCGDLIWWQDYLILSCFNYTSQSFELRAYTCNLIQDGTLEVELVTNLSIGSEIVRMSIFENRLLVLYLNGTLGMFMLNMRKKPANTRDKKRSLIDSSASATSNNNSSKINNCSTPTMTTNKVLRSDSIVSQQSDISTTIKEVVLRISPIENLIISNLKANSFCISSIALTRLHFKNNRQDDSILLNACGKLFLLEREAPPDHLLSSATTPSSVSNQSIITPENGLARDRSLNSSSSTSSLAAATMLEEAMKVNSPRTPVNSAHLASASLKTTALDESPSALANVTFKAVSVIATNVEQFWISPEISKASEMSYFKRSLWLLCGGKESTPNSNDITMQRNSNDRKLHVWLPLLNDKYDPPNDLYVPDRIMLPIRCDIYPLAIRSSSANQNFGSPDDAIVLGAESEVLYRDCKLFTQFPYTAVKRQCRVYLHRILRELLLSQHLGYYAKKIAESCQSLPYFAHCFELLLHEVLEEEATSPVPLPDPMLPQVVKFIKQFPSVYQETVVHCARKSELSMWSHLFDERAVGNPRRLFQECLESGKLDTAASCLIILQSLDRNIVSSRMVKELMRSVKCNEKFKYLTEDLENFLARAELDRSLGESPTSPTI